MLTIICQHVRWPIGLNNDSLLVKSLEKLIIWSCGNEK